MWVFQVGELPISSVNMNVWVFLCGWTAYFINQHECLSFFMWVNCLFHKSTWMSEFFRWMNCPFHQSTWMSEFFRWMNCPFHQSTWMSEFFRWMNCPFHQSTCMSIKSQMTAHVAIWQSKTRWINYSVHPPPFKKKNLLHDCWDQIPAYHFKHSKKCEQCLSIHIQQNQTKHSKKCEQCLNIHIQQKHKNGICERILQELFWSTTPHDQTEYGATLKSKLSTSSQAPPPLSDSCTGYLCMTTFPTSCFLSALLCSIHESKALWAHSVYHPVSFSMINEQIFSWSSWAQGL